jgi:hypothetical protein
MTRVSRFFRGQRQNEEGAVNKGQCPFCGSMIVIPDLPREFEKACTSVIVDCPKCDGCVEFQKERVHFTSHP